MQNAEGLPKKVLEQRLAESVNRLGRRLLEQRLAELVNRHGRRLLEQTLAEWVNRHGRRVLEQRLAELVNKHGRKWKKIALILTEERYRNKNDDPFSAWAIQKRCDRRPGRQIPINICKRGLAFRSLIERVFVPDEDLPFQVMMARTLLLGTFLESIGQLFRDMALHHVCDSFSEQSFYWFVYRMAKDPSDEENSLPTDFGATQLESIKSALRSVVAELSTLPRVDRHRFGPWELEHMMMMMDCDSELVMRRIVDRYGASIGSKYGAFNNANPELPPLRRGNNGSRKAKLHRKNLGGTIDSVLYNLFHEHKKKLGISASRMLDTVLWHWFDRPWLSYENDKGHPCS